MAELTNLTRSLEIETSANPPDLVEAVNLDDINDPSASAGRLVVVHQRGLPPDRIAAIFRLLLLAWRPQDVVIEI
jgi:hypothetical protein